MSHAGDVGAHEQEDGVGRGAGAEWRKERAGLGGVLDEYHETHGDQTSASKSESEPPLGEEAPRMDQRRASARALERVWRPRCYFAICTILQHSRLTREDRCLGHRHRDHGDHEKSSVCLHHLHRMAARKRGAVECRERDAGLKQLSARR